MVAGFFDFLLDEIDGGGIVVRLEAFDLFFEAQDVGGGELGERLYRAVIDGCLFVEILVMDVRKAAEIVDAAGPAFWRLGSSGMRLSFSLHRSMYSLSSSSAVSRLSRESILRIRRLSPLEILEVFAEVCIVAGDQRVGAILHDFAGALKNPSTSNLGVAKASSDESVPDLDIDGESDV